MGDNVEYRVQCLEDDMGEVREDVKTILTNHLPHMTADLAVLKSRITFFGTLIMAFLTALIGMVLSKIF